MGVFLSGASGTGSLLLHGADIYTKYRQEVGVITRSHYRLLSGFSTLTITCITSVNVHNTHTLEMHLQILQNHKAECFVY